VAQQTECESARNHLKRDAAARVMIDWLREAFVEFTKG